jgi:hypothetical protein
MPENTFPSAADLRAAIARKRPRLHLYELAVMVGRNPVTLSAQLNERAPLDPTLAAKILRALESR